MDRIPQWNVVHHLKKGRLLAAINCLAGLSIFFFGYDQGMMAGVRSIPRSATNEAVLTNPGE